MAHTNSYFGYGQWAESPFSPLVWKLLEVLIISELSKQDAFELMFVEFS